MCVHGKFFRVVFEASKMMINVMVNTYRKIFTLNFIDAHWVKLDSASQIKAESLSG